MPQHESVGILLVDDNAENLVALEATLHDLDERVVKANSGKDALRLLLQQDFAVILLDVNMPIMDGFETAALIRSRPRSSRTPIIFITAYGDEQHLARGYSLGAVDFIPTPVVPDVLRTKVSVFVELFRQSEEIRRKSESLRRRTEQLHRLTDAALAVSAATSVDTILALVVECAREVLGAEGATAEVRLGRSRQHAAHAGTAPLAWTNTGARVDIGPGGHAIGYLAVAPAATPPSAEDRDLLLQLAQMASIAVQNTVYAEERETDMLRDEFLATVSHELRTPLAAVLTWASLLRQRRLDEAGVLRAIEVIERNARAQAQLIDDLLDMSRIITGKLRLDLRRIDLRSVVTGTLESVRPAADARGLAFESVIADGALVVTADPERMQQVCWNLLSNAIKFTPKGGRVDVHVARGANHVEILVRDTGSGIPPEFLPHVFDRFRQADSGITRTHRGLGLGLAIVRHLIELQGGTVWAESAGEGCGAAFTVRLPLAAADADGVGATVPLVADSIALPTDGRPPTIDGVRVLLVEDEPDACEALARVLTGAGATVRTAASVGEALALLEEWIPDILLSDIGLPREDGYSLMQRVRALDSSRGTTIPGIALTAYARAEDRARALAAGFQMHLAKPIEANALIGALAALCMAEARNSPAHQQGA